MDIRLDRLFKFDGFFAGICVIKPQIAEAVVLGSHSKIQADRFRMANMQIPVRLGGEARVHAAVVLIGAHVFGDTRAYEV